MPDIAAAGGERLAALAGGPPGAVTLHLLGTGGVLFDAASRRLYAANTTATFIWCCLEDGDPPADVADRLHQTFGLPHREARDAVAEALRAWQAVGLIGGGAAAPSSPDTEPAVPAACASPDTMLLPAGEYRLLDTLFRLRCSSPRLRRRVAPILSPLAADAAADSTAPVVELGLTIDQGRFVLRAGATILSTCQGWEEVVPMVKGHLNLLALEHSRDFAAIHAAAVSLGRRCVLLPAETGRGKSTLAAALAAAALPVLGDDTIVIADDTLEARAMPFGICVKIGAWRLLAPRFPTLSRRPKHRRSDGKIVRYLLPRDGGRWAAPSFRQAVGWIVFPARAETGRAELRPVAKLDAMARLLRGFYPLGHGLDADRVDRLVTWLDAIDCLELRYASLDDAVAQLKGLA